MQRDDWVIVVADPLEWGVGRIDEIAREGQIIVEFTDAERVQFGAHELELVQVWMEGRCHSITERDYARLRLHKGAA